MVASCNDPLGMPSFNFTIRSQPAVQPHHQQYAIADTQSQISLTIILIVLSLVSCRSTIRIFLTIFVIAYRRLRIARHHPTSSIAAESSGPQRIHMERNAWSYHFDSPNLALLDQKRFRKKNARRSIKSVEGEGPPIGQNTFVDRSLIDHSVRPSVHRKRINRAWREIRPRPGAGSQ